MKELLKRIQELKHKASYAEPRFGICEAVDCLDSLADEVLDIQRKLDRVEETALTALRVARGQSSGEP